MMSEKPCLMLSKRVILKTLKQNLPSRHPSAKPFMIYLSNNFSPRPITSQSFWHELLCKPVQVLTRSTDSCSAGQRKAKTSLRTSLCLSISVIIFTFFLKPGATLIYGLY